MRLLEDRHLLLVLLVLLEVQLNLEDQQVLEVLVLLEVPDFPVPLEVLDLLATQ